MVELVCVPGFWKSAKQCVIVASTEGAEFMACIEAIIQANWLHKTVFQDLEWSIVHQIARYLSYVVLLFFKIDNFLNRAKHMDLKYFAVKKRG